MFYKIYNLQADAYDQVSEEEIRENSIFYNIRISSTYSQFDELSNSIFEELYPNGCSRKEAEKKRTILRLLRNLAYSFYHSTALAISMDSKYYSARGRNPSDLE